MISPVAHHREHQCRDGDPEPDVRFDETEAEPSKGEAEAELKAGRYTSGQRTREAAHHPGHSKNKEESANDESGSGNRRRVHRFNEHSRRCCLHRLHRHGDAVEGSGQGIEQAERGQDAGRVHPDDCNSAHDVRQKHAEITE